MNVNHHMHKLQKIKILVFAQQVSFAINENSIKLELK